MNHFKIYLAGPISFMTHDESEVWRDEFKAMMPPMIRCYSPLRQKAYLRSKGIITQAYPDHPLSTARGIMSRDHFDCQSADLIVCNLLGTTTPSLGTVMEIGFAYAYRKPLVLMMEETNIHWHPMIIEAAHFIVGSLEEAAEVVEAVLLP